MILATASGIVGMSHVKHGIMVSEKYLAHNPSIRLDCLSDDGDMALLNPTHILVHEHVLVRNVNWLINPNIDLY